MVIVAIILFIVVVNWGYLLSQSKRKYKEVIKLTMDGLRLQKIAQPMLFLLDKIRLTARFPIFFYKLQRSIQKLEGEQHAVDLTHLFLAEMLSYSWLLIALGSVLSFMQGGDMLMLVMGFLLAVLLPVALVNDLYKKVSKREHEILLELPELLNKIVLLVGAGSTAQQAIIQCLERKVNEQTHPLYRELLQMQREWESGYSFQQALEAFSKRCGVQEVSVFTTTMLLNYRRGGQDFALALRELSHSLWEKRKSVSRTLGEQASSKLVFPMVFIFIALVILIGAPGFMMMNF